MHDVVEALQDSLRAGRDASPTRPLVELDQGSAREGGPLGERALPPQAARWLDIHHAVTTAVYIALLWPGWLVAGALPPRWKAVAHLAIVCIAAIATSLRLHLWFSARHYPEPVAAPRHRWWPVLTSVDVVYGGLLGWMAILAADVRLIPAVVTAGLAVCLVMASLVIEPATRRATQGQV